MRVPARRPPIAAPNSLARELQILLALGAAPARLGPHQRRDAPATHGGEGSVLNMARRAELEDLREGLQAPHPRCTHGAVDSKVSE
jgi:hypothetical protein